jgi:hypothetical protein
MVVAQDANQRLDRLAVADPDRAAEMRRLMAGEMPRREAQLARFSPRAPCSLIASAANFRLRTETR